jgi:hypothetical protein
MSSTGLASIGKLRRDRSADYDFCEELRMSLTEKEQEIASGINAAVELLTPILLALILWRVW